jgi:hypothetical protein
VQSDHISNAKPDVADKVSGDRSKKMYRDTFLQDGGSAVGLVSRFFSQQFNAWVTLFGSNHGPFFEGLGRYLTTEQSVCQLFEWMGTSDICQPPPNRFELLCEVKVDERDRVSVGYPVERLGKRIVRH